MCAFSISSALDNALEVWSALQLCDLYFEFPNILRIEFRTLIAAQLEIFQYTWISCWIWEAQFLHVNRAAPLCSCRMKPNKVLRRPSRILPPFLEISVSWVATILLGLLCCKFEDCSGICAFPTLVLSTLSRTRHWNSKETVNGSTIVDLLCAKNWGL